MKYSSSMTIREHYAGIALQGLLASDGNVRWQECVQDEYIRGGGNWMNPEGVARKAVEIADALIAALNKKDEA